MYLYTVFDTMYGYVLIAPDRPYGFLPEGHYLFGVRMGNGTIEYKHPKYHYEHMDVKFSCDNENAVLVSNSAIEHPCMLCKNALLRASGETFCRFNEEDGIQFHSGKSAHAWFKHEDCIKVPYYICGFDPNNQHIDDETQCKNKNPLDIDTILQNIETFHNPPYDKAWILEIKKKLLWLKQMREEGATGGYYG